MKKVLVLMLVLGMASLANAGLILTINGAAAPATYVATGPFVLGLSSDTDSSLSYVTLLGEGFTATLPAVGLGSGDMGSASDWYAVAGGQESAVTQAWSGAGTSGAIFATTLTRGQSDITVQLWDDALGYGEPAQVVTITPEPATMLILGLGGLLLRRK